MRHLAVAEACPIDRTPVGRRHCSTCTHFVSFRSDGQLDTVGCDWGEDTVGWLRREMTRLDGSPRASRTRPLLGPGPSTATRPAPPARRATTTDSDGPALLLAACAVGVGLFLSVLGRRPTGNAVRRIGS